MKKGEKEKLPIETTQEITTEKIEIKKPMISKFFVKILAVISILGFFGIITESLFDFSIDIYIESFLLFLMGIGFIYESEPNQLFREIKKQFQEKNFTAMTTLVLGTLAIITGVISLPQINWANNAFLAIKGVIGIIAIIFIIIQTWVIK